MQSNFSTITKNFIETELLRYARMIIKAVDFFKIKYEEIREKNSKDPIDLPESVCEKIFRHMNARDLLTCTLVSSKWNKYISSHSDFVKKFRLVLYESHHGKKLKFSEIVRQERKYENLAIINNRGFTEQHVIVIGSLKIKTLILKNHSFTDEIQLINFFGIFEPTIEHLDMELMNVVPHKAMDIARHSLHFPKLKKLRIDRCCAYILTKIFCNVGNVEELIIDSRNCNPSDINDRIKASIEIITNNSSLKKLTLNMEQNHFNLMFAGDSSTFDDIYQLEELRVWNFRQESEMVKVRPMIDGVLKEIDDLVIHNLSAVVNFQNFLYYQQDSLKYLHLSRWLGMRLLKDILLCQNCLKTLILEDLESCGIFETLPEILPRNESIETLVIKSHNAKYYDIHKNIISQIPNLKHLTISNANNTVIDTLAYESDHITSITTDHFSAYEFPDHGMQFLKKIEIRDKYPPSVKDMLREKRSCTNFEKRFLEAAFEYDRQNYW